MTLSIKASPSTIARGRQRKDIPPVVQEMVTEALKSKTGVVRVEGPQRELRDVVLATRRFRTLHKDEYEITVSPRDDSNRPAPVDKAVCLLVAVKKVDTK
ncbi:hypothetical protein EV192_111176 [Actinocrispum wychmicini]|uniref:Uncharacterized protein n=1 Tax=Actinocrispum wychmicini TaxID=1213861 RepID=A0A4R2J670_9PSEU|nr:hypothetical protein EV192_111176 [Actinocrispum wychmicini]